MSAIGGSRTVTIPSPPAELGIHTLSSSAVVFRYIFSGTTYYAAIRTGVSGWVLLDLGTVPEDVINQAFTTLGAGARVTLLDTTYALDDAGIAFSANNQGLEGQGRGSFVDGDNLATTVHAINLSGYDDCFIKNLSVQTEDGGGKTCYCIFIEDGSDRFLVSGVVFVESDDADLRVEGTNIEGGSITQCEFLAADTVGIETNMDAGNFWDEATITENHFYADIGTDGLGLSELRYATIANNSLGSVGGNAISLTTVTFSDIEGNLIQSSGSAGILTSGSTDNDITGNTIYNCTTDGIALTGADPRNNITGNLIHTCADNGISIEHADADYVFIEGNYIYLSGEDGIELVADADLGSIIGNFIYDNGTTTGDWVGIRLNENKEWQITANTILDNDTDGVFLAGDSDNNWITGNFITDNGDHGIDISAATCNSNIVLDNYLQGNTTACINDSGTDTELPTFTVPFVHGTEPNIAGYLVNGTGDSAYTYLWAPLHVQQILRMKIYAHANPAEADAMRLEVECKGGASNEWVGTHDGDVANLASTTTNFAANDVIYWTVTTAGLLAMTAGDSIRVRAVYEGAGNGDCATNAYMRTVTIEHV